MQAFSVARKLTCPSIGHCQEYCQDENQYNKHNTPNNSLRDITAEIM